MWNAKQKTRVQLLIEQSKLRAKLNREQDIKNKKNIFSKYERPATNQSAIARGCSLNLVRQGHRF